MKPDCDHHELIECLQARIDKSEGKLEDRVRYISKDPSMGAINESLAALRRESMRGDTEESTVLIRGETGTGKEGIARLIHMSSRRGKGPWVAVNCSQFSEHALEVEFFGHEGGVFPGVITSKKGALEIAHGGTLFLQHVYAAPEQVQEKLLKAFKEKTFCRLGGAVEFKLNVRLIAATTKDVLTELTSFLSHVVLEVPPLRERFEDIVSLATQFAERSFRSAGKVFAGLSPEVQEALQEYSWPGNVHELMSVMEHAALLGESNVPLNLRSLPIPVTPKVAFNNGSPKLELVTSPLGAPEQASIGGYMTLKKNWSSSFEREYLVIVLARNGGNVSAAAREAQLDRSNFLRLMRRHGLRSQEYRKAA
jgi:DNA-binding NtrC family response regulator